jgi:hypothetical protein
VAQQQGRLQQTAQQTSSLWRNLSAGEDRLMPSTLHDLSFEQLAAALELREDSQAHLAAKAEITIRQMRALLEAAESQKRAAEAQEKAAEASAVSATTVQRNAHLILALIIVAFASVFVAMVAAASSAFSAYYGYLAIIQPR